jgi:hypothetical protein
MTMMMSAEQKADSKPVNLGTSAAKSVSHGSRIIGDIQSVFSLLLHVPFTIGVLDIFNRDWDIINTQFMQLQ